MKASKMQYLLLAVLVIGLGGLSIVYANLTEKLEIISTAEVKDSTWDIHFVSANNPVPSGTAEVTKAPKLENTQINELAVSLTKPGDVVTYDFKIANAGTIDAVIDTYKINTISNGIVCTDSTGSTNSEEANLVCNNLIYTLTYAAATTAEETGTVIAAGTPVAAGQKLKAEQDVDVRLTIGFSGDATAVPANDVTISGLDTDIDYIQD